MSELPDEPYVVLDTNQWFRVPMLRHNLAAPLLYQLRETGALLAIPDMIRREVEHKLLESNREANASMLENAVTLRRLFSEFPAFAPRDDDAVLRAFRARLRDLDELVIVWEEAEVDYVSAAKMVLDVVPPNGPKNQQFKDSVIWSTIARASVGRHVVFVTADNDFSDKTTKELHPKLRERLPADSEGVTIVGSIEELLDMWSGSTTSTVVEDFKDNVLELFREATARVLPDHTGLEMVEESPENDGEFQAYLTEDHDVLLFSGAATFDLYNPGWNGDFPLGVATVKGTATVAMSGAGDDHANLEELVIEIDTSHDTHTQKVAFARVEPADSADVWRLRVQLP